MLSKKIAALLTSLTDFLHLAVPARATSSRMPGYRPLGRAVVPYQFMKPVPVPVRDRQLPR